MKEGSKKNKIIIIIIILFALATAGGYYYYRKNTERMLNEISSDVIYPNIYINNVNVGGLSYDEALAELDGIKADTDDNIIILSYDDIKWSFLYSDLGAGYDFKAAVDKAFSIGRTGRVRECYEKVMLLRNGGREDIDAEFSYNSEILEKKLVNLGNEIYKEAVTPAFAFENGAYHIIPAENGRELNAEETLKALDEMLMSVEEGEIALEVNIKEPEDDGSGVEDICLLGTYYTTFSLSAYNRNENLRVGCEKINGTVIKPGEVFSMNEGLGEQTVANGYKLAGVIIGGKLETGIGGGVCQITTTLYNAAIRAELEIVERFNHSVPVGYVPLGMDATLAGTVKDLKIRNNTEYNIYLETYLENNKLIANVYGHETHEDSRKVEFERVYITSYKKPPEKVTIDPTLPEGERIITYKGTSGSKISVYKLVYKNDELISREWFNDSVYTSVADEVTVGGAPVSPPIEETLPEAPVEEEPLPDDEAVEETPEGTLPEEGEEVLPVEEIISE